MNCKMMVSAAAAVVAFGTFGATTVSDVVARQRWPWSEKVDIDYTLTGDKGDVTFSATWDGQATPVILGTEFQVEAGQHRFEWCPTNNYAGQTLTGFTVTAEAGNTADHKYLILDLVDGGYTFMAAPPAGGWTDEYKSTKMVFARCPAGTYTNGVQKSDLAFLNKGVELAKALNTCYGRHITTFTSDWYIGIYALTESQYSQVVSGVASSSYAAKNISYDDCRGKTNDTPSINWPHTKYAVTENSFIDKLRKKSKGTLCIDLSTEEQFETALRAGTSTFWPNGGTRDNTLEEITNIVNQCANWYYSTGYTSGSDKAVVGYCSPNQWGVYDIGGYGATAICLDVTSLSTNKNYPGANVGDATDPVGSRNYQPGDLIKRVVKGGGEVNKELYQLLPSVRWSGFQGSLYNVRFAIHLKPLNFGN